MANGRIAIDPALLMSQSAEMLKLTEDYDHLLGSVSSSLTTMNTRWSANLSNNFAAKIKSAGSSFDVLTGLLRGGAESAKISAEQFLDIDSVLEASLLGGLSTVPKKIWDKIRSWFHKDSKKDKNDIGKQISDEARKTADQATEAARQVAEDAKREAERVIPDRLTPNMGDYSWKQGDYSSFKVPYGYNAGCCATAYAIGLSIVTGEPHDPTKYWHDGPYGYMTYFDDGHKSEWSGYDPQAIYQALQEGHPTELGYIYESSPAEQTDSDHYVLITGIREGADVNNLTYEDFIVIDPAHGDERPLTESWKFNPSRVNGGFTIQ